MIGGRKSLERTYPHVPTDWMAAFLMELRMRGVSGPRIGDLMEEVESHCATSGQDARAAFGEPRAYAGSLDHPGLERAPALTTRRDIAQGALMLTGAALLGWGGHGAIAGSDAVVTRGSLALAVASLAVLTVVLRWFDVVLRHPWWGWVGGTAAYLLAVTTMLRLWPEAAVSLPAGAVLGVGAVAMLVAAVWATRTARSPLPDLIVRPGDAPERRDLRAATAVQVAAVWLLPALMAGLLASMWLASR